MRGNLHFHIRYVQPLHIEELINILALYGEPMSYEQIMKAAKEMDYDLSQLKSPDEQIRVLRRLGIVGEQDTELSELGKETWRIYQSNRDLFFELFHFFLYSTWRNRNPSDNVFSWTYRQICTYLWYNISHRIDVRNIASQLERTIIDAFPGENPSVGPDTVRAALVWLNSLSLSCLSESSNNLTFTRRAFCPPELMIMVINSLYQEKGVHYASSMLLTAENVDALCCACLLEKEAFDEVLSWSSRQFDLLQSSMSGGGWGRYLTLMRKPELMDLV